MTSVQPVTPRVNGTTNQQNCPSKNRVFCEACSGNFAALLRPKTKRNCAGAIRFLFEITPAQFRFVSADR
jgi:hypothetical protein